MDEPPPLEWNDAGRIVLPGKRRWGAFALVLVIFTLSVGLALQGAPKADLFAGAALLALVFFTIQLIPGANRLELTGEAFTCIMAFRPYRIPWRDVKTFAVDDLGNVVWDYAPHVVHESRKARSVSIARRNTGFDACLPETYGLSAGMLAALLNRLRVEGLHETPGK